MNLLRKRASSTGSCRLRCASAWKRADCNARSGPVSVKALEQILARSTVPILRVLEDKPSELALALVPSVVRTMLVTFLEDAVPGSSGVR
jgi:hypothetical protein